MPERLPDPDHEPPGSLYKDCSAARPADWATRPCVPGRREQRGPPCCRPDSKRKGHLAVTDDPQQQQGRPDAVPARAVPARAVPARAVPRAAATDPPELGRQWRPRAVWGAASGWSSRSACFAEIVSPNVVQTSETLPPGAWVPPWLAPQCRRCRSGGTDGTLVPACSQQVPPPWQAWSAGGRRLVEWRPAIGALVKGS